MILCNDYYIEMYRLSPDSVKPGISMREIVDLLFEAGSVPAMSRIALPFLQTGERSVAFTWKAI